MTNEQIAALPWYQRGALRFLGWPLVWESQRQTDRSLAQTAKVIALANDAIAECQKAQAIARELLAENASLRAKIAVLESPL